VKTPAVSVDNFSENTKKVVNKHNKIMIIDENVPLLIVKSNGT